MGVLVCSVQSLSVVQSRAPNDANSHAAPPLVSGITPCIPEKAIYAARQFTIDRDSNLAEFYFRLLVLLRHRIDFSHKLYSNTALLAQGSERGILVMKEVRTQTHTRTHIHTHTRTHHTLNTEKHLTHKR